MDPNKNNLNASPCINCGGINTDTIPKRKAGCVAIAWCIFVGLLTGGNVCCFIPLATDGCKDIEMTCGGCGRVK